MGYRHSTVYERGPSVYFLTLPIYPQVFPFGEKKTPKMAASASGISSRDLLLFVCLFVCLFIIRQSQQNSQYINLTKILRTIKQKDITQYNRQNNRLPG